MTHLGNFGVERPPLAMTFGWFGSEIRVEPNLTDTVLMDFLKTATAIEDEAGPEAMQAIEDFLRALIDVADFDRFWMNGRKHRQNIEDLMKVAYAILEAATDRPTQAPIDSSDGRSKTVVGSTVNSPATAVQRALEAQGRPDIAVAVLQRRELSERKAG